MKARKNKAPADKPRPNTIKVSLSDETLAKVDDWRRTHGHKRAAAGALLIERALDAAAQRAG